MKKFVQVRIKTYNHTKTKARIKHDIRKDNSKNIVKDPYNYVYIDNELTKYYNNDKKKIKEINDKLEKKYNETRAKHNEIFFKNYKKNLRERNSTLLDGVITFSELTKNQLENKQFTELEYFEKAREYVENLAQENNSKVFQISLHMDETTPHFHFQLENFNEYEKTSMFFRLNKKEKLSKLQDEVGEKFSKFGLKRGIKKDFTNKRYQETKDYHEKKITQLQETLEEKSKKLDDLQDKEQATINNFKEIRNSISKNTDIDTDTKKDIYSIISEIQNYSRDTKKNIQIDKDKLKVKIQKDTEEVLEKSKKMFSYDSDLLYKELYNKLSKYSNFDMQLEKITQLETQAKETQKKYNEILISLKNENKILENENDRLTENNIHLVQKLDTINKKIENAKTLEEVKEIIKTKIDTPKTQINTPINEEIKISKDIQQTSKISINTPRM